MANKDAIRTGDEGWSDPRKGGREGERVGGGGRLVNDIIVPYAVPDRVIRYVDSHLNI